MARIRAILVVALGATLVAGLASASETITYSYDAKGRLILVQHAGSVNNNLMTNYTFDKADNRKKVKVTGAP